MAYEWMLSSVVSGMVSYRQKSQRHSGDIVPVLHQHNL